MTAASIAVGVISFWIVGLLGLLFVGGLLLRHDVSRAAAGTARTLGSSSATIENLRPLQDTIAEFIVATASSRRVLEFLSRAPAVRLRDEIVTAPERTVIGLMIIALAGLVRVGRGGLRLTDAGHEMAGRVRERSMPAA